MSPAPDFVVYLGLFTFAIIISISVFVAVWLVFSTISAIVDFICRLNALDGKLDQVITEVRNRYNTIPTSNPYYSPSLNPYFFNRPDAVQDCCKTKPVKKKRAA